MYSILVIPSKIRSRNTAKKHLFLSISSSSQLIRAESRSLFLCVCSCSLLAVTTNSNDGPESEQNNLSKHPQKLLKKIMFYYSWICKLFFRWTDSLFSLKMSQNSNKKSEFPKEAQKAQYLNIFKFHNDVNWREAAF